MVCWGKSNETAVFHILTDEFSGWSNTADCVWFDRQNGWTVAVLRDKFVQQNHAHSVRLQLWDPHTIFTGVQVLWGFTFPFCKRHLHLDEKFAFCCGCNRKLFLLSPHMSVSRVGGLPALPLGCGHTHSTCEILHSALQSPNGAANRQNAI